jgi:hypothetical protein
VGLEKETKVTLQTCALIFVVAHGDRGPSGGCSVHRPGSEDPHRCGRKFNFLTCLMKQYSLNCLVRRGDYPNLTIAGVSCREFDPLPMGKFFLGIFSLFFFNFLLSLTYRILASHKHDGLTFVKHSF